MSARASKLLVDAVIKAQQEATQMFFVRRNKATDYLQWEVCKRADNCEHEVLYWFPDERTAETFEARLKAQHVADTIINY